MADSERPENRRCKQCLYSRDEGSVKLEEGVPPDNLPQTFGAKWFVPTPLLACRVGPPQTVKTDDWCFQWITV